MNKKLRAGKASELAVAGELVRRGVDVYMPCVDDQAIDLVVRAQREKEVVFYDVQVKSVAGYNRIVGVRPPAPDRLANYLLVIDYRHANRPDEFFFLRGDQITKHTPPNASWGDLIFNKPEREAYAQQDMDELARFFNEG